MNGVLTTSQNIEGNIGSCAIESAEAFISTFQKQVYFVNSCTGEVVSQSLYTEWVLVVISVFMVGLIAFGVWGITTATR